ncbi:MAG: carbamoyltransferase HypF [Burkholderiales bacterium RIFCSPLOWO2_12_FULL_64_99]|nr:MAG: carbamoyltransferase HypF [Burkholderiales bacterium RIFCSPHIGHO2_12_FULL_63_20]OGB64307.1 MAG: carbamoyltransferase HypF [Burkholderiales bacterium RIFCSPLOWO2_12_FULL_64_99]
MDALDRHTVRRRLILRGQVQGVGCRPWVCQQARALGVRGWVRNTVEGVELLVEGAAGDVTRLVARLPQLPAPGRVDELVDMEADAPGGVPTSNGAFAILPSPTEHSPTPLHALLGADLAVCDTCLTELFDPTNRRWLHPFIHCPQCGPRYTVTRRLPFDRANTSLADFDLCPRCEAEMHDPHDRRFHDQTQACPDCGARLSLFLSSGEAVQGDAIAQTWALVARGGIVALQGVGGFHLCCDARQPEAVARLRRLKRRPTKPLAVMAANVASLRDWLDVSPDEARWLTSPERPIVLLNQRLQRAAACPGLAPHLHTLGVMLPYTPVHHLLFHEAAGRPVGTEWLHAEQPTWLVMTSGNAPGEPLVIDHDHAWRELAPLADALLLHDRAITARNDDSVLRVRPDGSACWLRRGRGYAPLPLSWPARQDASSPTVLALGGELKATLCLSTPHVSGGTQVFVSPHVGNLDNAGTRMAFDALAQQWPVWRQVRPTALACDLHPDFYSSRLAAEWAGQADLPLIPVQHHHAHIAAVLAEHAHDPASLQPVIGLALDGHGLGSDGQAWGGELLRVHRDQCQRLGHLHPLPLPGGERAAREPWRLGIALLHTLGRGDEIAARFADQPSAAGLQSWLAQAHAKTAPASSLTALPHSTSLGRLFDAAAGVLRVLDRSGHEGDAAMRLESLAARSVVRLPVPTAPTFSPLPTSGPTSAPSALSTPSVLDWRPLMHWLCDQATASHVATSPATQVADAAAVFHLTLARDLAAWATQACVQHDIDTVVLIGGCLANRLLDDALTQHLHAAGLRVWRASHYPCGDGGLSLGQAWVAHHRLTTPVSLTA